MRTETTSIRIDSREFAFFARRHRLPSKGVNAGIARYRRIVTEVKPTLIAFADGLDTILKALPIAALGRARDQDRVIDQLADLVMPLDAVLAWRIDQLSTVERIALVDLAECYGRARWDGDDRPAAKMPIWTT